MHAYIEDFKTAIFSYGERIELIFAGHGLRVAHTEMHG